MGSRSRKRRDAGPACAAAPPPPGDPLTPETPERGAAAPPKRVRGEAADALARAELEPIDASNRPAALIVAALVAAALGLSNLVLLLIGIKIQHKHPPAGGILLFAGVMFAAAGGMWQLRYWAVLGFQALLLLLILIFFGLLIKASNLLALVVSVAVIGLAGWLFYKLIRVMARIQMPQRPTG